MKALLHIAMLFILLMGCRPSVPKDGSNGFDHIAPLDTVKYPSKTDPTERAKSLHSYWDTANGAGIYCDDTTNYSMAFIRAIRVQPLVRVVYLANGHYDDGRPEPAAFPAVLNIEQPYYFKGKNAKGAITLGLIRSSFTTLQYQYQYRSIEGIREERTGQCILSPSFHLGSESDDGRNGAYLSDDYFSEEGNGCFSIRLGLDENIPSAYVTIHCAGSIKIDLHDCPQLLSVK